MKPLMALKGAYDVQKENYRTSFKSTSQGSAYITRNINGTCTAIIDKSGDINLSFSQDSDEISVNFSDIRLDFEVVSKNKQLGDLINMTFPIEITNKEQELFVQTSQVTVSNLMPDVNIDQSFSGAGKPESLGWDDNIWKPRSPPISL